MQVKGTARFSCFAYTFWSSILSRLGVMGFTYLVTLYSRILNDFAFLMTKFYFFTPEFDFKVILMSHDKKNLTLVLLFIKLNVKK